MLAAIEAVRNGSGINIAAPLHGEGSFEWESQA